MKKNKLKLITLILLVILIIMVGFFGVYSREKRISKNNVKDYEYATNIKGARVATFELEASTDAANHENYELTKQIIKARLERLGVTSYVIRLDEETGKLIVELPENDDTDNILNIISTVGKFEIVDADTKEVLLNNDAIATSNVYRNTTSYGTEMSFSIEFTSDGAKKLEEVSKNYVAVKEENKTENSEEAPETNEEATAETSASETATEEKKEKKVSFKLDDTELMSTSFDEPVTNGKMYLTVGQAATTSDDVKNSYTQAQRMSTLLSSKPLPLKYNNNSSTFVEGALKENITNTILISVAIIIALTVVLLFVKYKAKGLFAGISFAGLSALLLLTIRYWNVELSKEGIVAIFAVLFLNFIFFCIRLTKAEGSSLSLSMVIVLELISSVAWLGSISL